MTDRYLLVKGRFGLAGRIHMLLTGAAYCSLSGRKLLIDWSDRAYSSDGSNVFSRYFCRPSPWERIAGQRSSVIPAIWKDHLGKTAAEIAAPFSDSHHRFSIDTGRMDYNEEIAVLANGGFRFQELNRVPDTFPESWRGLNHDQLMRHLIAKSLQLAPDLHSRIEGFKKNHFKPSMIGVHIRQTDNMTKHHIDAGFGVDPSTFPSVIEELRLKAPHAGLFLATDNHDILKWYIKRYPDMEFLDKWFPESSELGLHWSAGCPDKPRMGEDALVELYLLASCETLIFSSASQFGKLATLLPGNEGRLFVDIGRLRRRSQGLQMRQNTPLGRKPRF